MTMSTNPVCALRVRKNNHRSLTSAEGHHAHVFILEDDLIRVMLLPNGTLNFPQTWVIAPVHPDVPY